MTTIVEEQLLCDGASTSGAHSSYVAPRRPWLTLYGLRLRPGGRKALEVRKFSVLLAACVLLGSFGEQPRLVAGLFMLSERFAV